MKKQIFFVLMFGLLALSACSDDDNGSKDKTASVGFYLTDAPAVKNYAAVNIDIRSISYSLGDESWVDLPVKPSVIELLQFSNGKDSLLSNIELESGVKVTQIRLVLGDNNSLVLGDGTVVPLKVPSGQTSGLKFNVQSVPNLTSGYRVVIDFDAASSIVAKGNGSYSLKPVIRAYIEANTSAISGKLMPENEAVRVFTLDAAGDTISTVSDTLQGNYYKLHGLFSGTYDIQLQDITTGDFMLLKSDISVVGGTNVDLGTLPIP